MREHIGIYRGKRKDNGAWVEGWYCKVAFGRWPLREAIIPNEAAEEGHYQPYEVDPETVGECTGLRDKNGELIFEGDICDHHVQGDILVNRGVVNWDTKNGRWAFQLNTMNPDFYMNNPAAWEIIGNVVDNPELLQQEN